MSGAYRPYMTIAANVSFEALGRSESGSSNRSSIQVPPFTGVPPSEGVLAPGAAPPQALSNRLSMNKKEKAIINGRNFLSIMSSLIEKHVLVFCLGTSITYQYEMTLGIG